MSDRAIPNVTSVSKATLVMTAPLMAELVAVLAVADALPVGLCPSLVEQVPRSGAGVGLRLLGTAVDRSIVVPARGQRCRRSDQAGDEKDEHEDDRTGAILPGTRAVRRWRGIHETPLVRTSLSAGLGGYL
jgi:hypothetical protein